MKLDFVTYNWVNISQIYLVKKVGKSEGLQIVTPFARSLFGTRWLARVMELKGGKLGLSSLFQNMWLMQSFPTLDVCITQGHISWKMPWIS